MILIVGVGNEFRSDDGIGAFVVQKIEALHWPGVETFTTSQLHLEAIDYFLPYKKIIIVDAAYNAGNPGIDCGYDFQKIKISTSMSIASSHHLSLEMFLALAKSLYNQDLNLFLCRIKGLNFEIGSTLSPCVLTCVPNALQLIAMEIGEN